MTTSYSRRSARRSIFDTIAYRIVSQISTVLAYVILVRSMSKVDFGIFSLLYSFIPVVGTIASLGLEQTLRRFQPEYLRQGFQGSARWLTRIVSRARLVTNVLVLTIILISWNSVARHFGLEEQRAAFLVFSLVILLHFQASVLQLSLASHMLHRYSVGGAALLSIGRLILYSILGGLGALTLHFAILADAAAYSVMYVALRSIYRRECERGPQVEVVAPSRDERSRLVRYGLYNNFNDAGTLFLDSRTDNFFIAAFMNPIAVGTYSFYMRLNEMAYNMLPGRLFENVIQPMFFAIPPSESDRRIPGYFTFLLNVNLLVQWPILAYAIAYNAEIVQFVFGGKFIADSWVLPLIVAWTTVNVIANPVSIVAQYEERARLLLASKTFAVYNVVAMLLLVPRFGVYGAAIASGSAQLLKNAFIWWHVRRRAVWRDGVKSCVYGVGIWSMAIALCYSFKLLVHTPPIYQLLFGAGICIGAAGAYMRSAAIGDSDRTILAALFPGREARILRGIGLLPREKLADTESESNHQ